jgi:hypothetical protein
VDVDEFTQNIIQELRRPQAAKRHVTITGYTTTDEHIKSWWKKMRVGTASNTFRPSFSEIIAGTEDVAIAEVDAAAIDSIAALTGYCPKRWSEAIDAMIPKADSKHVKKLYFFTHFSIC